MFEHLVITNGNFTYRGRKWYFLFSSTVLSMSLIVGIVTSLFSADISLGAHNFELVRLVTPVIEPVTEPEPPAPDVPPAPAALEPTKRIERPTRQINMARVDESPVAIPKAVSSQPNAVKERPADLYFEIGKLDADLGGIAQSSGRTTSGGTNGSGSGLGPKAAIKPAAAVEEPEEPPPPRVKSTPAVAKIPIARSLGVINGKAIHLPKPAYPSVARAINARGTVNVQVLINESGRVVSANAVSGNPVFRNAAEAAAREARFSPTFLSGSAVKVSGVIVYNFLG